MLTHLQLRDLVLVDQAELEFSAGLTALTGETGAGKSIVVDALLLIAGGRAAGDVVRQGAERAEITASFATLPAAAVSWLDEQSIDHDGELVVRRVVGADGRSRAYVNGQVVPLLALRELAEFLIEIHGQQEFQHLVSRGAQRELLDERLSTPALKDTVALGDGWGPVAIPPPELARELATLKQLCVEAGRDFNQLEISMFLPIELSDGRTTKAAYREAGCHRLVFTLWPDQLNEKNIEEKARQYLN